ncbi:aldose epimerase family protein [Clostridium sp. AM58-1XD]|uniref:aldose epimerase family protein n=1 Tax=Clostridium sp. AM58-1XD TaxID=2292307 RepID=UPI000E53A0BF|nr:aldose epimerase family protein [Clostridium sp. AM58-1XD]RGY97479.1 galactose mutarotase [Clostridium sp. AM58-1XD]
MSYKKTVFGKLPDGRQVDKYTLMNENGLEASFLNLGAVWNEMKVPDRNGTVKDVILGFDTPEPYLEDGAFFGAIVGRNANRIGGAAFQIAGTRYELAANDHSNNLHSGPDFYRNRLWDVKPEETEDGTELLFSLKSPDGDQGYPGEALIEVRYVLTRDNAVKIRYHMVCDKDTVANFTNHCYFNLAGQGSGSALRQEVYLNADRFTPSDAFSIPTGEIRPVMGTPMDFRKFKAIGEEIDCGYDQLEQAGGYDHNWVLNDYNGEVRLAAKARDRESGRVLEAYTDLPGIQFYTGNYIGQGVVGKEGCRYVRRQGYCFETQYFPNAINEKNFISTELKAGEEYKTTTIYRFVME